MYEDGVLCVQVYEDGVLCVQVYEDGDVVGTAVEILMSIAEFHCSILRDYILQDTDNQSEVGPVIIYMKLTRIAHMYMYMYIYNVHVHGCAVLLCCLYDLAFFFLSSFCISRDH